MSIGKEDDGQAESSSPILFRLERGSGVPPFLQLTQQVERAVRLGYLKRGDQLPRIKDVVASLLINPNTVQKAYRNLEQKGLVKGRPGQGTFIEAAPEALSLGEFTALSRRLREGWLREAFETGLDEELISALFINALREESELRGSTNEQTGGKESIA